MKIISIVGKVDSRPLVYPLARGLAMAGQTGIITDDGAYRRLYHGKGDIGTVSGVDIGVTDHVTEQTAKMLDKSGIPYDFLLLVSTDYIHPDSTGILACHGLDRSMLVNDEKEEDPDEEFFFLLRKKREQEAQEAANSSKKGKKATKSAGDTPEHATPTDLDVKATEDTKTNDNTELTNNEDAEKTLEEIAANWREELEKIQAENPDKIIVPPHIKMKEAQIAFAPLPKKGMDGVALKDGLIQYVYNCEEMKQLSIAGKDINTIIVKLFAELIEMDPKELSIFLVKEEGKGAPNTGKKKK